MDGAGARVIAALACSAAGALIGFWIGWQLGWPTFCATIGAMLSVGLWVAMDTVRGRRVLRWLRDTVDGAPPADTGLWGELAYRAERRLRERDRELASERQRLKQFLTAMDASPNGVLLLDADDSLDWCNRTAAQHFGLDPVRDLRQRITNLVRAPAFKTLLGDSGTAPARFVAPDGRTMLAVLARPYGEGQRIVLSQDITERERAEAMRRDFVANVSHEIRTPLTVLAGFIETMGGLALSADEHSRVLDLMAQQARRMQELVADLLTLAQLEGRPDPPTDQWTALAPLLQRADADARVLSAGRHALLVEAVGDVEIAADEAELSSAVGNLLSNAVRYTPPGGRISMRWRLRTDGSGVLEVADTGIGIAREHLPRLTERFYRVDGSRSRATGGTGLGLSIVKHVMLRVGGDIEIDSEPGKGSCFRLVFPALRLRQTGVRPLRANGDATAA